MITRVPVVRSASTEMSTNIGMEERQMTRRDEWVVRVFQAVGLLIFLSGFVFFRWALLIWFLFVIYMTIGWTRIDDWARYKTYVQSQKEKESIQSVTPQTPK